MRVESIPEENREKINVYIPVRDRDKKRLLNCIHQVKHNNLGLVKDIVVIDVGSKKPIKPIKGVNLLRLETNRWNKAWGINRGIREYPNDFIMTLDVDMLLSVEHFSEISKNLTTTNFICDTNVRRVNPKKVKRQITSDDYVKLVESSKPWHNGGVNQLFNLANGGFQVYSKQFYDKMGGIQESLGLYHGAVDNVTYYRARMMSMNIVDVSYPLLHVEHKKKKEANLPKNERRIAERYRLYKSGYLSDIVAKNLYRNPEKIAGKNPSEELFEQMKKELMYEQQIVQEAINRGDNKVTVAYQTYEIKRSKSILVCVINNKGYLPSYFVWDLIKLFQYTQKQGIDIQLQEINACSISHMRNLAIKLAQQGKFDYVVQLDDDHHYPPEFIADFLSKMEEFKWPILTLLTAGKKPPYKNTQYHKFLVPMDEEGNAVECKRPKKQVIQIEASGPVGMVMETKLFKNLNFPYYYTDYKKREVDGEDADTVTGSDLVFCRQLKEKGIPIMLDLSVSAPHCKELFLNRGKVLKEKVLSPVGKSLNTPKE